MANEPWEVVVLGAGAAGLMAAIRAAELGKRVLLLEKNRRPGVKILMSGGTRCNLTHDCDEAGIVAAFGSSGKFLHSALTAFGVRDTIDFFETENVPTKIESTGKVFPVSNKAADVLNALLRRLHRSSATILLNEPANELSLKGSLFAVHTPSRCVTARRVILTTGGKSYPASGTNGDGYRMAAVFGHSIIPPRPALTPITTDVDWISDVRGITIPNVTLTLHGIEKKPIVRRGSLLFAHFGLSGPVALDLSRFISGHRAPISPRLFIDLAPTKTDEDIERFLTDQRCSAGKQLVVTSLSELMPHRLAGTIAKLTNVPADRRNNGVTKIERRNLVECIKQLPVPIRGTLGFEKAEVTAGGVCLDEVSSSTMQSKLLPGFFLAGEVLDLDGPIGGYNFQAAWSTGWLAGTHAAK